MPSGSIGLSKSRVMAGLQCHKRLWWTVHEPEAPELLPDGLTQALLDDGARVGAAARAYVPGGVFIDLPYQAYAERLSATREAMARGAQVIRSEEHTSELQSRPHLVCRLLLEKKKQT